jgi:hypothetical protein
MPILIYTYNQYDMYNRYNTYKYSSIHAMQFNKGFFQYCNTYQYKNSNQSRKMCLNTCKLVFCMYYVWIRALTQSEISIQTIQTCTSCDGGTSSSSNVQLGLPASERATGHFNIAGRARRPAPGAGPAPGRRHYHDGHSGRPAPGRFWAGIRWASPAK